MTHKDNLDRLQHIDDCTYPAMRLQNRHVTDIVTDKKTYYCKIASKVSVKGRNGETYYIPVVVEDKSEYERVKNIIKAFKDKCELVRDHFITTEGLDVLTTDYNKIKDFNLTRYINETTEKA